MAENVGKVVQVIGPTVDCEFPAAIKIADKDKAR